MSEIIFDTHAHVLSADRDQYPYSSLRGGFTIALEPVVFSAEQLIAAMNADGIDFACLVQRATLYGYDNRYALDATERYPDRFVSVIVLDGQDPASPGQLRELAKTRNVAGLRIVSPAISRDETDWIESDETLALWKAAADLDLPVTIILYRHNNEAGRAALLRIAKQFRSLPILIDHVGVPHASTPELSWGVSQGLDYSIPPPPGFGIADSLAAFEDFGNVHFKVTDINFDRLEDDRYPLCAFVRALADRFGGERLLWGSDVGQSPTPYAEKIDRLLASARLLSKPERARLFGGTAYSLYGHKLWPGL